MTPPSDEPATEAEASISAPDKSIQYMLKILRQQEPSKLIFANDERKKFELQDLMKASMELLRDSDLATTVKAVMADNNDTVVVKMYKQMNVVEEQVFNDHMKLLGSFKHPNLVPIVAYMDTPREKFFVMEYVSNGSLASHIYAKRTEEYPAFTWQNRLKILKGVIAGVTYLFRQLPLSKPLFHGNLKSSNVLVDKDFNALVSDYVLDPLMDPEDINEYLAAYKSTDWGEMFGVTKKSDVWCLGVMMMEMFLASPEVQTYMGHGSRPYGKELNQWINDNLGSEEEHFDAELLNMRDEHTEWQMYELIKLVNSIIYGELDDRMDWMGVVLEVEKL